MKRVLITGASGFIGSALAQKLTQANDYHVVGISRSDGDVADTNWITSTIKRIRPDWIVHLAGCSSVKKSMDDPLMTLRSNTWSTASILDAVRSSQISTRVLLASSAEVYAPSHAILSEQSALSPQSTYAYSKKLTEQLGDLYAKTYGVDSVTLRIFYTIGVPLRSGTIPPTIPSGFAYRLAQCEITGSSEPLRVGDISKTKDFIDLRDALDAIVTVLERGKKGEIYNVCTGTAISYEKVIASLQALSTGAVPIVYNAAFERPFEVSYICGSHEKLTADTGWQPRYDILRDTLPNLLDYWRKNLQLSQK